jgi:lipopolysaccharide export system protein LptA
MAEDNDASAGRFSAAQLELLMRQDSQDIRSAIFSGDVSIEGSGTQAGLAKAQRVAFNFAGKKNILQSAHTEGDVKLLQHLKSASGTAQDLLVRADAIDFAVAKGKRLARAETSGAAQIELLPVQPATAQATVASAGKFLAHFDGRGRLQSLHGESAARIVVKTPGQPDQITTSQNLDATFHPGSGIQSLVQQGNFTYTDGERKAWAQQARYTLADHMIILDGSPRVADTTTDTTARTIRLNRETGDAYAEGNVKSSYRDLKPQSTGALLASSSPIHVTADSMTAHRSPAVAVYTGNARLWQDANILEASSIQFDRDHRSVLAQGSETRPVSTALVQADKNGAVTPVTITSARFTYTDANRLAHFEKNVQAKGADLTVNAAEMDVYLKLPEQQASNQTATPGKIDHIIAKNQVVITQPGRHAEGEQLTYTAAEDKFVLTGGPPSIFDAEHGKVTGVSLTFFRSDDRVLVEGNNSHPTVTQTRVAR